MEVAIDKPIGERTIDADILRVPVGPGSMHVERYGHGSPVAYPAHMPEPLIARYLAPYVGRDGVDHLLRVWRFINRDDLGEIELRALPHPTLIVWGDRDPWASPRIGDQLADTIGGSKLVHLPASGRLVPEDAPESLANLTLDFIGARGSGGTV